MTEHDAVSVDVLIEELVADHQRAISEPDICLECLDVWPCETRQLLDRIAALEAALARAELEAVVAFVQRVNARAEARMQAGNPLEGSHHFSMQAELKALEPHAAADAGEWRTDG